MSSFAESAARTESSVAGYEAPYDEAVGSGWVAFSGVMLTLAGFLNLVDGLWAIDRSDSPLITDQVKDQLWYSNSLETWGWIYTIAGVVLIAAGIAVFSRSQWARWIGIFFAAGSMVINMMWVFVYPIPALIHVAVASMVVYGLTAYGGKRSAA